MKYLASQDVKLRAKPTIDITRKGYDSPSRHTTASISLAGMAGIAGMATVVGARLISSPRRADHPAPSTPCHYHAAKTSYSLLCSDSLPQANAVVIIEYVAKSPCICYIADGGGGGRDPPAFPINADLLGTGHGLPRAQGLWGCLGGCMVGMPGA